MSYTDYKTPEGCASMLLSDSTYKIPSNATKLRDSFRYIAKNKGVSPNQYGSASHEGYYVGTPAAAAKLWDNLVAKGVVVKTGEGLDARYALCSAQQESYVHYLSHYRAEFAEKAAKEAQVKADALAVQRWAVILVNLVTGVPVQGPVLSGADAEEAAYRNAASSNQVPGQKAIVVRLADADRIGGTNP